MSLSTLWSVYYSSWYRVAGTYQFVEIPLIGTQHSFHHQVLSRWKVYRSILPLLPYLRSKAYGDRLPAHKILHRGYAFGDVFVAHRYTSFLVLRTGNSMHLAIVYPTEHCCCIQKAVSLRMSLRLRGASAVFASMHGD
jgi:hypothetical protein